MKTVKFFGLSLLMLSAAIFAGCDKDDPADNTVPTTAKLVSRVEVHDDEGSGDIVKRSYELDYDAQNRVIKMSTRRYTNDAEISTISYPESNKIKLVEDGDERIFTLNSDGNIIAFPGKTFTYENGYLVKDKQEEVVDGVLYGTISTTYTWENGNLKSLTETYTTSLEYGTELNKPCSIDILRLITDNDVLLSGWLGKSSTNLPNKIIDESGKENLTFRYEIDTDGYVKKVYTGSETLRFAIYYK
jgi:hypothetical protein